MNMALDEVLWVTGIAPRIRFYQWDHPAVSFGYFGRYEDVAHHNDQQELVRRCTGGGVVFHGQDLTYAVIVPSSALLNQMPAVSIYHLVHQAIQHALGQCGIAA